MQRQEIIWMLAVLAAVTVGGKGWADEAVVGQPSPQFELVDSAGQIHKLSDYKGKVVVVHFQSCLCPWDRAYQPILNGLAKDGYGSSNGQSESRVQFLAVNSNRSEGIDQIKAYVQEVGMTYPILKDRDNQVADRYGATTTPHIFVIKDDDQQTLAYRGGIEKAPLTPQDCGKSQEQYLEPVLLALVNGENPPVSETQSIGCSIKRISGD